MTNWCWVR